MTFTRLADLALSLLWTLILTGVLVLACWFLIPGVVASIDQHFREIYLSEPRDRYLEIVNQYQSSENHEQLVSGLVKLLAKIDHVQKVDNLAPTKRVASAQLVRVFVRIGQLEQAMHWTDRWLQFDPKDIEALLTHARLLLISPDTFQDGKYEFAVLKARFPNSLSVANGRAIAYASIGQLGRAFLEFSPFLPGRSDPLKREIGATLRTIQYTHEAGGSPKPFTETFDAGESLALHITHTPDNILAEYDPTALVETPYGYRKHIGNFGMLHLFRFESDKDFQIDVEVKVSAPEALDILMQLQFRELIIEQLAQLGATEMIAVYENYHASL